MTCREYEPLIALYVEGDLDDREATEPPCVSMRTGASGENRMLTHGGSVAHSVERHLAECSGCREVLEDLRVSQAALKELSVVDAAFLSAVRSGVLERIERRRLRAWPWIAALAAVAALIVAVSTAPRKPAVIAKAPVYGGADPLVRGRPPGRPSVIAQATPKVKRSRPGGRLRTRGSAPPSAPLVVKMLTDDPNIVIIWLVEQRGD